MLKLLKEFWYEEEGIGTLEIVLILVVVIGMAVVFKDRIIDFFNSLISQLDNSTDNLQDINSEIGS